MLRSRTFDSRSLRVYVPRVWRLWDKGALTGKFSVGSGRVDYRELRPVRSST